MDCKSASDEGRVVNKNRKRPSNDEDEDSLEQATWLQRMNYKLSHIRSQVSLQGQSTPRLPGVPKPDSVIESESLCGSDCGRLSPHPRSTKEFPATNKNRNINSTVLNEKAPP
ncbi:hypothetical protein BGZ58_005842, partial [Dissophora ornata]